MAAQKLFGSIPAEVAKIPGMVTPNITADYATPVNWGAINAALARSRSQSSQSRSQYSERWGREDEERRRAAAEAKVRDAFNTFYGPAVESQWKMSQNEIVAPKPQGIPADWVGYQAPQEISKTGVTWGKPRPMPGEQYWGGLDQAWKMFKAGKILGIKGQ
jgi:hypothetical protein